MLITTLFNILEQAQLDECQIKVKLVNSVPTVVVQFAKSGATHKDSDAIQKLRKTLATPLFKQFEVIETIDGVLIEELGHMVESLTDNITALNAANAKKAPKAKKATNSSTSANAASSVATATTEPQPTVTKGEITEPELETTNSLSGDLFAFDASSFQV